MSVRKRFEPMFEPITFFSERKSDPDRLVEAKLIVRKGVDDSVIDDEDEDLLHALITRHHELTHSLRAEDVLENWRTYLPKFKKVAPLPHVAPPPPRDQQRARRRMPR